MRFPACLIGNLEASGMPASSFTRGHAHRDQVLAAGLPRLMGDGRDLAGVERAGIPGWKSVCGKGPAAPGALHREISEGDFL